MDMGLKTNKNECMKLAGDTCLINGRRRGGKWTENRDNPFIQYDQWNSRKALVEVNNKRNKNCDEQISFLGIRVLRQVYSS